MKRSWLAAAAILAILSLSGWLMTTPQLITADQLPAHQPDAVAGERVFWAGGCASCHASPVGGKRAKGSDKLLLGGGLELDTPYGVFRAPNISSHDEDGIGNWSMIEFVNAMQRGISPDRQHYYPSFPYTSYAKMAVEDVMDLRAYLDTVPAEAGPSVDHSLAFPWTLRRGIGAWKRIYLSPDPQMTLVSADERLERGRELVEGAGHCGECHTPRNILGGLKAHRWLAGAPSLEGKGKVPDITPAGVNLADWSAEDIVYYFESGFTPEFDTVGGTMVAVQENLSKLPKTDLEAIAAYLKSLRAD